jgi:ABC-type transport system involved in multi-copper enzyme maturation permease subunit
MEMQRELNNVWTIATKEFKDYVKSKRFILVGILYGVMALAILGITVMGLNYEKSMGMLTDFLPSQVLGTMDYLNIILVLLAVIITADTISAERKDRTIYQLLSKPVERSTVIIGKFIGCLGVVSFFYIAGSVLAYALTAVAAGVVPTAADLLNSVMVIVFMVLLFSVYVALGVLISTVTRNPLISILGGIVAWIALFFSNTIGNMIGTLSLMSNSSIMLGADLFSSYPVYAKALVWIDPISHDIIRDLLGGTATATVGMPFWANVVILLAYTGIMLLAAIELFKRQDL